MTDSSTSGPKYTMIRTTQHYSASEQQIKHKHIVVHILTRGRSSAPVTKIICKTQRVTQLDTEPLT
ncbi:uncharacterized protein DS421_17g582000 [Arachis hypogaea]|nr:uncharacterized protein DS421_17g582000 [Arachis hypogaea]